MTQDGSISDWGNIRTYMYCFCFFLFLLEMRDKGGTADVNDVVHTVLRCAAMCWCWFPFTRFALNRKRVVCRPLYAVCRRRIASSCSL